MKKNHNIVVTRENNEIFYRQASFVVQNMPQELASAEATNNALS